METIDSAIALKGKTVLVIGSGADVDGRALGAAIDAGEIADVVIRVNKHYGSRKDVGSRTDIIFTRWRAWLDRMVGWFEPEVVEGAGYVVALNENFHWKKEWSELVRKEAGVKNPSAGLMAVWWALVHGAEEVKVIGFGFRAAGGEDKEKRYGEHSFQYSGAVDKNPNYDFAAERRWHANQKGVTLL